ncbi:hypothetical protein BC938DRAFT_470967 [Jimgerdemannia flammicorona]|uniref:Uncharacterized protein n=1 Tax=Jimgerdemannia flammicorona TaxID=994334 RepID=A0A433Q905_9FUNG|nr:hypothetical protein BC938DRAFT_470967 [Jimgerdemannia flammicorona]
MREPISYSANSNPTVTAPARHIASKARETSPTQPPTMDDDMNDMDHLNIVIEESEPEPIRTTLFEERDYREQDWKVPHTRLPSTHPTGTSVTTASSGD